MGSSRSEFHMPGAYYDSLSSNPGTSRPSRALGADVFLPPADIARSTGSLFSSDMSTTAAAATADFASFTAKRKRPAQDLSRESTPVAGEYTLAGQIDVDGTQSSRGLDESTYYSDVEYRRQLGPSQDTHTAHIGGGGGGGGSGVGSAGERWTVLHALGSVVGKVWEFCTTSAFRGFQAGGGESYDWETGKPTGASVGGSSADYASHASSGGAQETDADARLFPLNTGVFTFDGGRTSLGGGGISKSYVPSRKGSVGTPPPRRNGKRRQVGPSGDELGRNWVMVDCSQRGGAGGRGSRASSSATMTTTLNNSLSMAGRRTPDRRTSQFRTAKSTTTTMTTMATATATATAVTPITTASPRLANSPMTPLVPGSPSTSKSPTRRQQRVSHAGSPALSMREPASFASPRASTPRASRRATLTGAIQISGSPGSGGSRIPVRSTDQLHNNPFARVSSSSRPSSALGQRSSMSLVGQRPASAMGQRPGSAIGHRPGSSIGQRPGSAMGQRPGSAMSQRPGSSMSPSPGHRRSHSARVGPDGMAREGRQKSPNKKMGILGSFEESPRLTEEAKRLAAKKLVAERDADAKMEALNHQLQMMIRQGREALGTTFEVDVGEGDEGDDGDEVWADDL